ncbi:LD-carboxypeptidase [Conchiformibius steedae]|uniref:LD-carboxypeptidase n=1 Tax=Conchiformibius steedae TaxID=153493 RepID=A0A3P2A508_9NEIS|nr:LD-carboxypeptidase [Conchiformibius steedae]RRD90449.1 LD-carboxypeptidase [Conchiformibius steedae]
MNTLFSRRRLLQGAAAAAGSSLLAACGSGGKTVTVQPRPQQPNFPPAGSGKKPTPYVKTPPQARNGFDNSLRLFASSGYAEDPSRLETGLNRLFQAGFAVSNHQAAYRRFQRFAGSDAERIADLQNVANGRAPVPKVLMGVRGGYGAARLLPHIDWASLAARMRDKQTLLFGFSDVTAIQTALLAHGMPSFAGPMLYSEFSKAVPSPYTMDSFIQTTTSTHTTVTVSAFQSSPVRNMEGTLWGGNLSVLASLAGSPYLPDVKGGILFLEDVSEQPYRIERMLYTLLLSGVLKKQQAIVLGDFRMGNIRDTYDSSYNLTAVAQTVSRAAGIPVYTGFPFGHIANKTTFPLGAHARLQGIGGGYQISFSGYPTLNPNALNLEALRPPPVGLETGSEWGESEF